MNRYLVLAGKAMAPAQSHQRRARVLLAPQPCQRLQLSSLLVLAVLVYGVELMVDLGNMSRVGGVALGRHRPPVFMFCHPLGMAFSLKAAL